MIEIGHHTKEHHCQMLSPTQKPGTEGGDGVAPTPSKKAAGAVAPTKKKFHNGWTAEIEKLMAEWADKAITYRWMHERTERIFASKDLGFMFPVIILSTVTGAANFALDSVIENPDYKKYAQLGLGGLSILTGIISTIANRLGYGSRAEAHKGAGIHWGKFQRLIAIELSLHPDERSDCMAFLKACRNELDRLIEQSPTIPQPVIEECRTEFKKYPKVRKPEIVGDISTTHVFVDSNSRLKKLAQEATITIQQKKGVLKQLVLDDLEPRIQRVFDYSTLPAVKEELREEIRVAAAAAAKEAMRANASGAGTGISKAAGGGGAAAAVKASQQERQAEVKALEMSGVVSTMRQRLREANTVTGGAPPAGVGALFAELSLATAADTIQHVSDDDAEDTEMAPPMPPVGTPVAVTIQVTEKEPSNQSTTE
jgi:hypothetical protein